MRYLIVLAAALIVAVASTLTFVSGARAATPPDGKAIFTAKCSQCHQATGLGNGPYPPLAGNPDVNNAGYVER